MTPRLRTRDKAMALLRQDDPDTSLTRFALDRLIRTGKLPTVNIGNKVLVNYDTLLDVVANGLDAAIEPEPGVIRRIPI